jgi:hypothetical protein
MIFDHEFKLTPNHFLETLGTIGTIGTNRPKSNL